MATTYLQCYGIKNDVFAPRSRIIKKAWGVDNDNDWVKLSGYWKDSGWNATTENYFVVKKINGRSMEDSQLEQTLDQLARSTIRRKYSSDYAENIAFFASNTSAGYEYPLLSPSQAAEIDSGVGVFNYAKFLRYAFAASYVYSVESGAEPFGFSGDSTFKHLMLKDGSDKLEVIETFTGSSGLIAAAIKVPAVDRLEEEILISYKGTSNNGDIVQDIELMMANLVESDVDWQKDAHYFCEKITRQYPPNRASLAEGYQAPDAAKTYNVVLTGHSLGGYTAIGAGVRSGILTRAFSSPATRIIGKYIHAFANTMRLNNVVNLIRNYDPVATVSGNHDENMIYFPSTGGANVIENHMLSGIIEDFLMPLSQDARQDNLLPPYVYITPDTAMGAGLEARINCWGDFNK